MIDSLSHKFTETNMTITNGEVTFSRKVKPADYEGADATVKLSFLVDEGQDAVSILDYVAAVAKGKALSLLKNPNLNDRTTLAQAAPPAHPAPEPAPAPNGKDAVAQAAGLADAAAKATGATPPRKPPGRPKKEEAAPVVIVDPAEVGDDVVVLAADPAAVGDEDVFTAAAPADVSDEVIAKALSATNERVNNAPAIRKLILAYIAPKTVGTFKEIGQDKRMAFLRELGAMQPAAG